MPILLEEDRTRPLPKMYPVRQAFTVETLTDIPGVVRREMHKPEIKEQLRPGMTIAVAVGSRGIRNLNLIVKSVIDELLYMQTKPYIIGAMGSHGGGTVEGQLEILHGYGITEEAMGVPVIASNDVIQIGETQTGLPVFIDRDCVETADLIIPINRIKLHTDFVDTIQSGLCKMLTIGLGHHKGCSALHESEFKVFGQTIKEAATLVLAKLPVGFGIAIIENACDDTAMVEAVPGTGLIEREEELVSIASKNMPRIYIPDIDVLIVEQVGKDISGAGYDPNILGRSYILDEFILPVPQINKMILLDVSKASHGNAIGMGAFDIITRNVFDQLDLESIYANSVAIKVLDDCKIPLIAANEEEAVRIAIACLRGNDPDNLKIVKIRDTLHLDTIWVSEDLLPIVSIIPELSLV